MASFSIMPVRSWIVSPQHHQRRPAPGTRLERRGCRTLGPARAWPRHREGTRRGRAPRQCPIGPTAEESEKPHCPGGLQCPQHRQSRRGNTQLRGVLQDECRRRKVGERACRYWPRWRRRCRPVGGSWLAIPPPSALRSPPNICATVPPIDLPQIAGTDPLCPRARRHRVAYGTGDLGLFGGMAHRRELQPIDHFIDELPSATFVVSNP